MKNIKRIISLLLAVLMLFCMMPIASQILKKEGLLNIKQRYRTKGGKSSLLYKIRTE